MENKARNFLGQHLLRDKLDVVKFGKLDLSKINRFEYYFRYIEEIPGYYLSILEIEKSLNKELTEQDRIWTTNITEMNERNLYMNALLILKERLEKKKSKYRLYGGLFLSFLSGTLLYLFKNRK